jgi:hypothetical protein
LFTTAIIFCILSALEDTGLNGLFDATEVGWLPNMRQTMMVPQGKFLRRSSVSGHFHSAPRPVLPVHRPLEARIAGLVGHGHSNVSHGDRCSSANRIQKR